MNININNNTFKSNARPLQTMFTTELKDNKNALVRMTFNDKHRITGLETIVSDSKNKPIDGRGIIKIKPLSGNQILEFIDYIQNYAKEGKEFLKEFLIAMNS